MFIKQGKSFGDILRIINDQKIVNDDFIIMSPETVTNVNLKHLLKKFNEFKNTRTKEDKMYDK